MFPLIDGRNGTTPISEWKALGSLTVLYIVMGGRASLVLCLAMGRRYLADRLCHSPVEHRQESNRKTLRYNETGYVYLYLLPCVSFVISFILTFSVLWHLALSEYLTIYHYIYSKRHTYIHTHLHYLGSQCC